MINTDSLFLVRATKAQKDLWTIRNDDTDFRASLSGQLRKTHQYPVIGDWVFAVPDEYGSFIIREIEKRKSVFTRPNRGGHAGGYVKTMTEEIIEVNFDYVFIVSSLNRNFNAGRAARYASVTSKGGGISVAILTKADLCEDIGKYVDAIRSINDKMDIIPVSSLTGTGLDRIKQYMKPGVTIVLLGSSGVGKSILINTLAGQNVMRVSTIREGDDKGRHITTHRKLIEINGVSIIDTPGMRELGLCDVNEGIEETFPDIAEIQRQCRFNDCRHDSEPGCAVQNAHANGILSKERWDMYYRMIAESKRAVGMKRSIQRE